jgi:hypothetical protein
LSSGQLRALKPQVNDGTRSCGVDLAVSPRHNDASETGPLRAPEANPPMGYPSATRNLGPTALPAARSKPFHRIGPATVPRTPLACRTGAQAVLGVHLLWEERTIHTSEQHEQAVFAVADLSQDAHLMRRILLDVAGYMPNRLVLVSRHVCDRAGRACRGVASTLDNLEGIDRVTVLLPPGRTGAAPCMATSDLSWSEGPYDPAPGWRILRVDVPDRSYAGATAIRLARRLRMNVIVPGMHRTVMIGETSGVRGERQSLWGLEMTSAKGGRASFVVIGPDGTKPRIVYSDADSHVCNIARRRTA